MSINVSLSLRRSPSVLLARQTVSAFNNGSRTFKSSSSTSGSALSATLPCFCGRSHLHPKAKEMRKLSQLLRPSSSVLCGGSQSFISSSRVSSSALSPRPNSTPISVDGKTEKWDIYAGVLVERKPVLTQKMDEFQQTYFKLLNQLEFEISKKSDHEIRHEQDLIMLEKLKSGEFEDQGNVNVTTARDDEDLWNAEAQKFTPASRETEADLKKDIRSLERALDSHLLLLVEQRLGNEYKWICPHSKVQPGENLRQASERMMREIFPELKIKVLGHAPCGFYKYKYPPAAQSDVVGGKVFFYKAQVVSGEPKLPKGKQDAVVKDFVWLKRDEIFDKLNLEDYYKKLSECLIDE